MKTSRMYLLCLVIPLLSCGWDSGSSDPAVLHGLDVIQVVLTPTQAPQMDGDGTVTVTAQVDYLDSRLDIEALYVAMPDGTTLEFDRATTLEQGTLTQEFAMSTGTVGVFELEFWLQDPAGARGTSGRARFGVVGVVETVTGEWTNRLSGLPNPLLDVAWDGTVFIAVGYGGAILTSVDGIDWLPRESGTEDVLVAVTASGTDIYAVGGPGILLSTDHGETWTVVARPDGFVGTAVAASSSQVVVLGTVPDLGVPRITISEDGGETWQTSTLSWGTGDLIYRDGLFVTPSGPGVMVSADGKQWSEIIVGEEDAGLDEVIGHDGSQYFVVGDNGTVYSSFDAFNWTELSTPLEDVDYKGAAWSGTQLMFAGGVDYFATGQDETYRPIGISSTDGGETWDVFGIDSNYESHGLAWGNGRFVSVGRSVLSDGGAIYTSD